VECVALVLREILVLTCRILVLRLLHVFGINPPSFLASCYWYIVWRLTKLRLVQLTFLSVNVLDNPVTYATIWETVGPLRVEQATSLKRRKRIKLRRRKSN
jgi:hypothetical protein